MAFDAGTITGKLGLDTGGFSRGILNAESMTRVLGGTFTTFLVNPLLGVVDLARKAATALTSLVTETAKEGDSLAKLAKSTGTTIEFLSGLRHAAQIAGTSLQDMRMAFARMVMNMTSEDAAVFESIGIQVRDASGQLRNAQTVFLEVADYFSGMENQTERAGLALQMFGRSAQGLVPLLSEGGENIRKYINEAAELGLVMDKDAGAAAERFVDASERLGAVWQGMKEKIAIPIFEALGPLLESLIPPLRIVADLLGGIIKFLTYPIRAIGNLFSGQQGIGQTSGISVNVEVDPESTADGVARKVAPSIARAARGVKGDLETSSRRNLDLRDWQTAAVLRAAP